MNPVRDYITSSLSSGEGRHKGLVIQILWNSAESEAIGGSLGSKYRTIKIDIAAATRHTIQSTCCEVR